MGFDRAAPFAAIVTGWLLYVSGSSNTSDTLNVSGFSAYAVTNCSWGALIGKSTILRSSRSAFHLGTLWNVHKLPASSSRTDGYACLDRTRNQSRSDLQQVIQSKQSYTRETQTSHQICTAESEIYVGAPHHPSLFARWRFARWRSPIWSS